MRILIAEDDANLAGGVQHALRHAGYAVDWVQNGLEADSALQTNQFDLLILDIGLPKKSGFDVLKCLRAKDSHLPVLILTALDGVKDCVYGLDQGADDYIANRSNWPSSKRACVRLRGGACRVVRPCSGTVRLPSTRSDAPRFCRDSPSTFLRAN